MGFLQALGVLLAFGSILFLTVIFTRLIAGKSKRAMKGQYINIIETVSLGLDKQIHLLKVDNQFVLIATAGKSVEFLTTLNMDNYTEDEVSDENSNVFDFKVLFEKYIQVYKNKRTGKSQVDNVKADDAQPGKYTGTGGSVMAPVERETFKSNLNRLKTITNVMYKQGQIDGDEGTNEK